MFIIAAAMFVDALWVLLSCAILLAPGGFFFLILIKHFGTGRTVSSTVFGHSGMLVNTPRYDFWDR